MLPIGGDLPVAERSCGSSYYASRGDTTVFPNLQRQIEVAVNGGSVVLRNGLLIRFASKRNSNRSIPFCHICSWPRPVRSV